MDTWNQKSGSESALADAPTQDSEQVCLAVTIDPLRAMLVGSATCDAVDDAISAFARHVVAHFENQDRSLAGRRTPVATRHRRLHRHLLSRLAAAWVAYRRCTSSGREMMLASLKSLQGHLRIADRYQVA